jgi:acyl-CoA dehydrogenase
LGSRRIRINYHAIYPISFDILSRATGPPDFVQEPPFRLLIDFFQNKGLPALKSEDRAEEWYQDWIEYQAKHCLYASVLSPSQYSRLGRSFNLFTLTRFLEVFAFLSPAHAYSLHVTFLGLFPILMSDNEALKTEAIAKLEAGGLFAFGVSEKAHGADLLANEFIVRATHPLGSLARGSKYYIGNANCAAIISILAKSIDSESAATTRRAPFVLFALRPQEAPAFRNLRKIRTLGVRSAFVGAFDVDDHPLPDGDVISRGRGAWEAVSNTVTFGKFFLGFGAIGICAHSFAEAFDHLRRRILYGRPAIELPHIRTTMASAFARLTAMRLYAYRALDYLQAASEDDRRYVLFNAVQKAKVSTEGVKVMSLISECIGARGFESDTYFESALREAPMIPGLEGSTHINFRLTSQFLENYFATSESNPPAPPSLMLGEAEPSENPYWFAAKERSPKTVLFSPFRQAYEQFRAIPNSRVLAKQVDAFCRFVKVLPKDANSDAASLIAIGRCFSTIAYAQLVAESCHKAGVPVPIVSLLFAGMIEDLSAEALKLSVHFRPGSAPRSTLRRLVRVHQTHSEDLDYISETIASRYER